MFAKLLLAYRAHFTAVVFGVCQYFPTPTLSLTNGHGFRIATNPDLTLLLTLLDPATDPYPDLHPVTD